MQSFKCVQYIFCKLKWKLISNSLVSLAPHYIYRYTVSVQDRVQPWDSDTETSKQGSKHFSKWVNIWQPKSNEFWDMSILGIFLEPLWNVLKWNRKLGSLCPWRPPYFPLWAKKDVWMEIKQCVNILASAKGWVV